VIYLVGGGNSGVVQWNGGEIAVLFLGYFRFLSFVHNQVPVIYLLGGGNSVVARWNGAEIAVLFLFWTGSASLINFGGKFRQGNIPITK
jgi:hypothetical protein